MARDVVIGVDSGTQSTKVVALDLETMEPVGGGSAPHLDGTVQDPAVWWAALRTAIGAALATAAGDWTVAGISVGAQQHGLVTLTADGRPLRPAPLWNDLSAASDAARLNALADFAAETGSRLVSSITIAKLAHLARTEPDAMDQVASAALPHDWLNFQLTGELRTDRGDASGSGWWSPATGETRRDLLALAIGERHARRIRLPEVMSADDSAGRLTAAAAAFLGLPPGIPVGVGSGDNMAAALGLGLELGEITVSLGTSGVVSCRSTTPVSDATGQVNGFADAAGGFLPLCCMLNCTRVVDRVASLFGIERSDALDRAGELEPGANGLTLIPYFGGERCPDLPDARGSLSGISYDNLTAGAMLRAAVDGVAAGVAHCLDVLSGFSPTGGEIVLTGGGAAHPTWRQAIADATGLPVTVRGGGEHAARGAALQALSVVTGEPIATLAPRLKPPDLNRTEPRPRFHERFNVARRFTAP